MKKGLLAIACALFLGQSAFAQAQEVTYVDDPAQGYLFNRFKDNWFITAEGGASMLFTTFDSKYDFVNRLQPAAGIFVGKWFSPIIGFRGGMTMVMQKGLASGANTRFGIDLNAPRGLSDDGVQLYRQKYMQWGPQFDVMLNVTNWWCGYKPNRVYNFVVYGGPGMYVTYARQYHQDGSKTGYKNVRDNVLNVHAGIINSFNLSKQVQLALDLRFIASEKIADHNYQLHETAFNGQALLSLTYLFNQRTWAAPVVPVCPEPENCDAYIAALAAADARIADLEAQLAACLARPTEVVEVAAPQGPLSTIYFPIGVSRLTREDKRVLNAVAEVMKANPDTKYVVTGWADNYTGTPAVNDNLRKNRAANVEKQLLKAGVNAKQLSTTTNSANLCDMGEKMVALDRAATINIAE